MLGFVGLRYVMSGLFKLGCNISKIVMWR